MTLFTDITLAGVYSIAARTAAQSDRQQRPCAAPASRKVLSLPFGLRLPFFGNLQKTVA